MAYKPHNTHIKLLYEVLHVGIYDYHNVFIQNMRIIKNQAILKLFSKLSRDPPTAWCAVKYFRAKIEAKS